MNKIFKWSLISVCFISMVNFLLFLGNKSIFMSDIKSFASQEGFGGCPWCTWNPEGNQTNGGQVAGPSLQPTNYTASTDFTVTSNATYSSQVTEGVTKSHSFEAGLNWKIFSGKANRTSSHTTTQQNGNSTTQITTMTFHYTPNGTVYDVKCVSPQLVDSCEEKYGWADGFKDFMDNVVKPIMEAYGWSFS